MRVAPWILAASVLAAGLASSSAAQETTAPDWLKKPTDNDLLAVFPREALRQGLRGEAILDCLVTVQGALRECRVASETPFGKGFGGAAMTLSRQFQMRPATKNGVPVESRINIPIHWPKVDGRVADLMLRQNEPGLGTLIETPETRNAGAVISGLVFREAPTVADVAAAFPLKAREARVSGRVTLNCRLSHDGGLADCRSLVENPRDYGFAGAARQLAAKFKAPATTPSGQPLAGASTQVTVVFDAAAVTSSEPVIGKPRWTELPTPEDFRKAFAVLAKVPGVSKARVVLSCAVMAGGVLNDCHAESEEPAGYGLDAGGVGLSGKFKVGVWTDEGLPTVGGRVRVPIVYNVTDAVPPPAAPAKP